MNWDSIYDVTRYVNRWADIQFPKRTPTGTLLKLYGEIGELAANPNSPHEAADIMILFLDYCKMNNIDLPRALLEKMEINEKREWIFDAVTGLARHVERKE
jgi:NTP pyrophosphatase (non-canonical NTP hydrolase)